MKCGVKFPLLANCILRLYFMGCWTFYDVQITEVQMMDYGSTDGGLQIYRWRITNKSSNARYITEVYT